MCLCTVVSPRAVPPGVATARVEFPFIRKLISRARTILDPGRKKVDVRTDCPRQWSAWPEIHGFRPTPVPLPGRFSQSLPLHWQPVPMQITWPEDYENWQLYNLLQANIAVSRLDCIS